MATKTELLITARDNASRVIDGVQKSLGGLGGRAAELTKILGGLPGPLSALGGAVSVAGIAAAVKSTADYADGLGKLAQVAGVTTQAMSELAYAGSLSNASNEEVAKALQKIGADATAGGKKLAEFGVEVRNIDGSLKSSDQLLREFADRLAALPTPSERSSAAIKLLGEEGAKLVPLLSGGSRGLKDMAAEAQRFGKVVTDDAAKAAAEFNDNLTRIAAAADLATKRIGNLLIPILGGVANAFLTADKHGRNWLETLALVGRTRVPGSGMSFETVSKDLREARDQLAGLENDRKRQVRANSDTRGLDDAIAAARINIEYLKDLQRQTMVVGGNNQSSAEARRLGLAAPPVVAGSSGSSGDPKKPPRTSPARDQVSDAERYIQSLQRQLEATQNLSVAEQLLRDIQMGRLGRITPAQEAVAMNLAAELDATRQFAEIEQQFAAAQADTDRQKVALREEALRVYEATRTPLERLNAEEERLNRLLEAGALSAEIHARAMQQLREEYGGTYQNAEKAGEAMTSAAKDLGLSFTSAFEDAIVQGKNLSEVLRSLEQDIMRIITRKLVTEPLGNAITGMITAGLGSLGTGVTAGVANVMPGDSLDNFLKLNNNFQSFDGGGYTGNGARSGGLDGKGGYLAMLHPRETVIDHTKGQGVAPARVQNINITVPMPSSGRRETAMQFGADVARQLRVAGMRNG